MIRKFFKLTLAATVFAGLAACAAAQQPNMGDDFSILSVEEGQMGREGRHGKRKAHGGMMMKMLMRDLNLSDAQQAEFKALRSSAFKKMKAWKPSMQEAHALMKTAFLAESFDRTALEHDLSQLARPQSTEMAHTMAEHLIQAWNILTPEQRGKLEQRLDQFESRMKQFKAAKGPRAKGRLERKLAKMSQALNLSEAQRTELKQAWEAHQPDREGRYEAMRAAKSQVLTALKSGQASAESLGAVLEPMTQKAQQGMTHHLDRMETLHRVLNAEQRQKLLDMMAERHQRHKRKRHH